jgi:hypothetical protein
MKQKSLYLLLALMMILTYSCKKETGNTTDHLYPNFSQLKIGNYWVYEYFDIDQNGSATSRNVIDSCYIEKDTMINGKTYFKYVKPDPNTAPKENITFQKDSLHYIVNSDGKILFSSEDFSTIFDSRYIVAGPQDTVCKIVKHMADKNIMVSTPAGTFTTLNAKDDYSMYPNWASSGNSRSKNTRYAEKIGIISETFDFYISQKNYVERRLIRYHVK